MLDRGARRGARRSRTTWMTGLALDESPPGDTEPAEPAAVTLATGAGSRSLMGLVLAGALAWWALAAVRIVRFHRAPPRRRAGAGGVAGRDRRAGRAARPGRPPTACLVPGHVPPMLWAIGRRAAAAGAGAALVGLGDDERTSLLLHELAHLRRRDHWVRWLRAGGRRALLVAPGRLVDPPGVARGRGTVLRRLGRLGDAPAAPDLCGPHCWRPSNSSPVSGPSRPRPPRPRAATATFPA